MAMNRPYTMTRRGALALGYVGLAAALDPRVVFAAPKQPGEIRALLLTGDVYHSETMQELQWRRVVGDAPWTLLVTRNAACVTPDVIDSLDLLVLCRSAGWDAVGFSPDLIVEEREAPGYFMTDETERSIIGNVRDRGMGLIATHCTVYHPDRTAFLGLLGVAAVSKPAFNDNPLFDITGPGHPVMRGVGSLKQIQEQIWPVSCTDDTEPLLTLRRKNGVSAPGGWCRTEGAGRVVVLTPGHMFDIYIQANYRRILWNAANWAMGIDPPDAPHITND